ncbi:hypothetical protein MTP06_21810 [Streptomyces sp. PLM4]|nr:hypothetical protein MTP06_21810 [Streptomyces sp. PLM4]
MARWGDTGGGASATWQHDAPAFPTRQGRSTTPTNLTRVFLTPLHKAGLQRNGDEPPPGATVVRRLRRRPLPSRYAETSPGNTGEASLLLSPTADLVASECCALCPDRPLEIWDLSP